MSNSIFSFIPEGATLRPIQIKVLSEIEANWNKYDVFVAPVPVGGGKSLIGMIILEWQRSKKKVVSIVTPQVMLQEQYKKDFPHVPVLKGKARYQCTESTPTNKLTCEDTHDICQEYCEGCPYLIAKRQVDNQGVGVFNFHSFLFGSSEPDTLIVDECFPANQRVVTDSGMQTIGDIYRKWAAGESTNVESFSMKTGEFEYKPVTYAWERPAKDDMVTVIGHNFKSVCTGGHKFLTKNKGWVPASQLEPEDRLISRPSRSSRLLPNEQQTQVVMGSYLGDGYVREDSANPGTRVTIRHSIHQEDYLAWKASILRSEVKQGGVSGYGGSSQVYTSSRFMDIPTISLPGALASLTELGLAIWFMDDGSVQKSTTGFCGYRLHTESYTMEQQLEIIDWFKIKYKIVPKVHTYKDKYHYLSFNKEDGKVVRDIIAPYVIESMRYKVLDTSVNYSFTADVNTSEIHVTQVVSVSPSNKQSKLYDISVADNHNFVITPSANESRDPGGVVVHNCHSIFDVLSDYYTKHMYKIQDNYGNVQTIGDAMIFLEKKLKTMEPELAQMRRDKDPSQAKEMRQLSREIANLRTIIGGVQANPKEFFFERKDTEYRRQPTEEINIKPLDLGNLSAVLWPKKGKVILMSGTINSLDIQKLGLGMRRVLTIDCPSAIDPSRRPIEFIPVANMSYKYQDVSVPIMAKYLLTLLDKHPDEKGLIHVPYQLAVKLRPHLKHKRLMWHDNKDKDEAYKAFRATAQPAVLVASGMAEGVDLPYDAGRWQAIIKIQYPSLADNLMKYFMNNEPSWYSWLTIRTLVQQCGRICRGPDDYGVSYILDVAFDNLLKYNKRLMPKYFLDALHIHKRPTK